MPLLTIVIPVYNASAYLADCLNSLRSQHTEELEVVVRDAGSTDGSIELARSYDDIVSSVVVRADHGQSDAIDRGCREAQGTFLTWLNADDVLLPGATASMLHAIKASPNQRWHVGDTALIDSAGKVTSATRAGACIVGKHLNFVSTYGPSSVFSAELYLQAGGLDLSFHYMMDTDLWNRFTRLGERYRTANQYWWGFRQHAESKTTSHMFSKTAYDPYAPSEYRQNAEHHELFLRYGIRGYGYPEQLSRHYAKLRRTTSLTGPLQMLDGVLNRGRHWSKFRRFPLK